MADQAGLAAISAPEAAAHAALLKDRALQFSLGQAPLPPPPPPWLLALVRNLAKLLAPLGPYVGWILWGALGLGLLFILVVIVRGVVTSRGQRREAGLQLSGEEGWRPSRRRAERLLEQADALALQGRFAEAVHFLLFQSVDDLETRRPGLIGAALTSREIARLEAVPPAPRALFAGLAAVVERAVFGGRPVDADAWSACRQAYSEFVFPKAWDAAA